MGLEYITQPQVFTATVCATDLRAVNLLTTNVTAVPTLSVGSSINTSALSINTLAVSSSRVFAKTTFNNFLSALEITVNGRTVYLPLLSAI